MDMMGAKRRIYKAKKGKLEHQHSPKLAQTCSSQTPPFLHKTHLDGPINAQVRSHLSPNKLG